MHGSLTRQVPPGGLIDTGTASECRLVGLQILTHIMGKQLEQFLFRIQYGDGRSVRIENPVPIMNTTIANGRVNDGFSEEFTLCAWKPLERERVVSAALQAYALMATSADKGAVRDVTQIQRRK